MKACDRCVTPILVLLIFLNACSKKPENHGVFSGEGSAATAVRGNDVLLHYTKQVDLPVPLGFKPLENRFYAFADKTIAWYRGSLPVEQCISFYKQSMEVYGWKVEDFSLDQEGLFVCKKAQKHSVISIRRVLHQKTDIGIILRYISDKEECDETADVINSKTVVF